MANTQLNRLINELDVPLVDNNIYLPRPLGVVHPQNPSAYGNKSNQWVEDQQEPLMLIPRIETNEFELFWKYTINTRAQNTNPQTDPLRQSWYDSTALPRFRLRMQMYNEHVRLINNILQQPTIINPETIRFNRFPGPARQQVQFHNNRAIRQLIHPGYIDIHNIPQPTQRVINRALKRAESFKWQANAQLLSDTIFLLQVPGGNPPMTQLSDSNKLQAIHAGQKRKITDYPRYERLGRVLYGKV